MNTVKKNGEKRIENNDAGHIENKKVCILILGMHRSGTSALTRLLNIAGAQLPINLMGAGEGNAVGHWEPKVIVDYNDALLSEVGSAWYDWREIEFDRIPSSRRDEIRSELIDIVDREYQSASLIVLKDPRICRLTPLYFEALSDAGYDLRFVLIIRNPIEVCESLEKRRSLWPADLGRSDASLLWLRHTLDSESLTRSYKRTVVTYGDLLTDWRSVYKKIVSDIDIKSLYSLAEIESQVDEFISSGHRHHLRTTEDILLDPTMRGWISDSYEAQLVLTKNGQSSKAMDSLDLIANEFRKSSYTLFGYFTEKSAEIRRLNELVEASSNDMAESVARYKQLSLAMEEKKIEIAKLKVNLNESEVKLSEAIDNLSNAEESIATLNDKLIDSESALNEARERLSLSNKKAMDIQDAYQSSLSWRLTAPARKLVDTITNKKSGGKSQGIVNDMMSISPPKHMLTKKSDDEIVFFTICSRNFLAYANTLYKSLIRFHMNCEFYVALCDDPSPPFNAKKEPFPFIYLDDLDLPDWQGMSRRYNITEFNTSIKPFVFKYLFERLGKKKVVYLDPDIYVVNRFFEIEDAFARGKTAILTPHMLEPAESAEMNEKRLLQYGIYNLGFLALQFNDQVKAILDWWGRRLIHDCVIAREEGLFVDQKWCDHFPAFIEDCLILHHPGYNVAYWNLSSRKVNWNGDEWVVNGQSLRFVHFSGHKLDDTTILSRHSSEHTPETIGELRLLLEEYRDQVVDNNHQAYCKIPYAFSWGGAKGVNEHTPRPEHQGDYAVQSNQRDLVAAGHIVFKQLSNQAVRAYRQGGVKEVTTQFVRGSRRLYKARLGKKASELDTNGDQSDFPLQWRKKLLFIDWSTPMPDQDSGSRTNYFLLRILALLGYKITFLPGDLERAGKYTDALEFLGISCLHSGCIGSIKDYLKSDGYKYDFLVLSRGPVVSAFFDVILQHCRNAKLIFNTVDLHYLREIREAELSGSKEMLKSALETKRDELRIVGNSHATIVLSQFEKDELENEAPGNDVRVFPLIFSEIDPSPAAFADRKDILFIGSFPHLPNIDAVLYFAEEVFPLIQKRRPDINWHIVGSKPPKEIQKLNGRDGIIVHGFVEDLTPLFRSVKLSVAPLRYGAGIKGKIATSMSYGVPVVASSIAVEGMNLSLGTHALVADDAEGFVDAILSVYEDESKWRLMSESGQQLVVDQFSMNGNLLRIGELMNDIDESYRKLDIFEFSSKREFDCFREINADMLKQRNITEEKLIPDESSPFDITGFCANCGSDQRFRTSFLYSSNEQLNGKTVPNWREHLACECCGLTMRLRASLHILYSRVNPAIDADIYITEQKTPLYKYLKARHQNLIGSEYLGDAVALGSEYEGLRNEDLTKLTFPDNSFDSILSFDVLEHVSDEMAAFRECYRCLKPGGILYFTVPFAFDRTEKVVRAEMLEDGSIRHLMEPEFHDNPVDSDNGALCYRYFAWDVIDDLGSAGFSEKAVINYWSEDYAYLGRGGFIIMAKKGA